MRRLNRDAEVDGVLDVHSSRFEPLAHELDDHDNSPFMWPRKKRAEESKAAERDRKLFGQQTVKSFLVRAPNMATTRASDSSQQEKRLGHHI